MFTVRPISTQGTSGFPEDAVQIGILLAGEAWLINGRRDPKSSSDTSCGRVVDGA